MTSLARRRRTLLHLQMPHESALGEQSANKDIMSKNKVKCNYLSPAAGLRLPARHYPNRRCNLSLMNVSIRTTILRANAIFLLVAATGGFASDIAGIFFGRGPVSSIVASAPYAGIGMVEAHGLAFIIGILLWRAEASRPWHLTAAAVHVLLGTANLVFWQVFVANDMLVVGYVTTSLHWLFVALQLTAAHAAGSSLSARV